MGGRLTGDGDDGQMARRGGGGGVEERRERKRRRGADGDGDGNNRWMTHDTIGAWYDADGWCDQWYWRYRRWCELLTVYRRCQLLIGHACNNRSDLVWESPVITGKLCLG